VKEICIMLTKVSINATPDLNLVINLNKNLFLGLLEVKSTRNSNLTYNCRQVDCRLHFPKY
jgi:hypothetical protein